LSRARSTVPNQGVRVPHVRTSVHGLKTDFSNAFPPCVMWLSLGNVLFVRMTQRSMGLRPVFFVPCTLVRTWGTRRNLLSGVTCGPEKLMVRKNLWSGETCGLEKLVVWRNLWSGETCGLEKLVVWRNLWSGETCGPEKLVVRRNLWSGETCCHDGLL
jgi:hypothetical protein